MVGTPEQQQENVSSGSGFSPQQNDDNQNSQTDDPNMVNNVVHMLKNPNISGRQKLHYLASM